MSNVAFGAALGESAADSRLRRCREGQQGRRTTDRESDAREERREGAVSKGVVCEELAYREGVV